MPRRGSGRSQLGTEFLSAELTLPWGAGTLPSLVGPGSEQEPVVHADTCMSGALSPVKGAWCGSLRGPRLWLAPLGTCRLACCRAGPPSRTDGVRAPSLLPGLLGPSLAGDGHLRKGRRGTRLPSQGWAEDSPEDLGLGSAQDCSSWPRVTASHGAVCFPCPLEPSLPPPSQGLEACRLHTPVLPPNSSPHAGLPHTSPLSTSPIICGQHMGCLLQEAPHDACSHPSEPLQASQPGQTAHVTALLRFLQVPAPQEQEKVPRLALGPPGPTNTSRP